MHQRLIAMGDDTNRNVSSLLVNPVQAREAHQWAAVVCDAQYGAIDMQQLFTVDERATANLLAPRVDIITNVADPTFIAQDLPSTIHMDVTPPLESATVAAKGVRFVAVGLRKLAERRV